MKIEFYPTAKTGRDFPPIPVKKAVPDWYKNVPNEYGPYTAEWFATQGEGQASNGTIKQCTPVLDYLTSGYLLRTQTETLVSAQDGPEEQGFFWKTASHENQSVGHHSHVQCPILIEGQRKTYIKLRGGYAIKTPPGYSCLFYQSTYSMQDKFCLLPAIVDTDTFHSEILFPGYLLKGAGNFVIEPGTPLVTVFPFKRDGWEHEVMDTVLTDKETGVGGFYEAYIAKVYRRFFHQPKIYK
jgi:hypothetical protein